MKTKEQNDKQSQVATAVSAALGSVAGVAIGTVASEELLAAEPAPSVEADVVEADVVEADVVEEAQPATIHIVHHTVSEPTPTPEPVPTPEPTPTPEPQPEPVKPAEVEVLSYETLTHDDGSQSDVAILSVNGTPVLLADVDQDGLADVMAHDANDNGSLDMEEVIDVSEAHIAMQPLQEIAGTGELLPNPPELIAQNVGLPDYVNDAEIGGFMA